MKVRVRFAPSPTGYLHIGGARTALFNWLYARHTGGTFVLRIEDTDAARNSQEAVDVILQGLRWLGLNWDEGPLTADATGPCKGDRGPYFQSQRKENYQRRVEALLARGLAYEHEGAIKFKMQREPILIPDLVVGDVLRKLTDREEVDPDFVIVRSDGQPVFHFVNVVDDLEMGITHVIRGEDHLSNTAKHIALFRAFGVEPPKYAHIPLILNGDGSKMSKRDRGASLTTYTDEGFLPEAVNNYLCLLGWSPRDGQEFFTKEKVAALFELSDINRSNARFDSKKLEHLHFEHTRNLDPDTFVKLGRKYLVEKGFKLDYPDDYVAKALLSVREKGKLFGELPLWVGFYFINNPTMPHDAFLKVFTPGAEQRLQALENRLVIANPDPQHFTPSFTEQALKQVSGELNVKPSALVQPCRVAVTGSYIGPSLYDALSILGRDKVVERLKHAIAQIPPSGIAPNIEPNG